MRRFLVLALCALALLGARGDKKKGGRHKRDHSAKNTAKSPKMKGLKAAPGNSFLKQGSNRAAIMAFRKQVAANPELASLHVGLGKALARVGKCDEALREFSPYVGTVPFGGDAALAAATCAGRLGLLDEAVTFDYLAVDLDPTSARALTSLALDLDLLGDTAARDMALEDMLLLRRDRDGSHYARAVIALRHGDLDEFDVIAKIWERDDSTSLDLRRLQALAWLDMDDPVAAIRVLQKIRSLKSGKQVRALRAEAFRRTGFPEEAQLNLADRPQSVLEGIDADSVRIRVLADLGDLQGARALLDDYDALEDADLIASEWYLAWITGDTARQATLAVRYAAVQPSPLRTLEALVPIPRRAAE